MHHKISVLLFLLEKNSGDLLWGQVVSIRGFQASPLSYTREEEKGRGQANRWLPLP